MLHGVFIILHHQYKVIVGFNILSILRITGYNAWTDLITGSLISADTLNQANSMRMKLAGLGSSVNQHQWHPETQPA